MSQPRSMFDLRAVSLEDAGIVSDLESAVSPDDERDPALIAFWWTHAPGGEKSVRWLAERDGAAVIFVSATHSDWTEGARRYGSIRVRIHPDEWSDARYRDEIGRAEAWLRTEGAETSTTRVPENLRRDLGVLAAAGYREVRRDRLSRLDLVKGRERLLATAEKTRAEMSRQGVKLLTLNQDLDPDVLHKLYQVDLEAEQDVPKTVPWPVPTYAEWSSHWFEHPGHRKDRFWIAREGEAVVGLSIIGYPPSRGIPWTSFTATARSVRGRGIARALKYETVAQAIALGATQIETANDAENAPILHLNDEMGYVPVTPVLELHRDLGA